MFFAFLLPSVPGLRLELEIVGEEAVTLVVRVTAPARSCPACGGCSTRIHSRTRRTVTDLPVSSRLVRVILQVQRFFCSNAACAQRTFTEQVPEWVLPRQRRTQRLQETLLHLGLALGGEAGGRLARRLGMPCSPDSLLRFMRAAPLARHPTPRVLGVDDWCFRRGKTYGTILLDLEQRAPIDLLPDREEATLASWLRAHPGVHIISRDRGSSYAEGARMGAPNARQVADRWHLLRTLGEVLEKLLARKALLLRQVAHEGDLVPGQEISGPPAPRRFTPQRSRPPLPKPVHPQRAWQLVTYQQVRELGAQGWGTMDIARHLHIHPHTARTYLDLEQFLDRRRCPRDSAAEPYRAYLEHRWAEGCTNRRQLWYEGQARGFTGSYISICNVLRSWEPPVSAQVASPPPGLPPRPAKRTPHQVAWLLLQELEELHESDKTYREAQPIRGWSDRWCRE